MLSAIKLPKQISFFHHLLVPFQYRFRCSRKSNCQYPTQIRVFSQSGVLLQTVAAQSDGTFSITNLPPGSYQLTVTAPNYAANTVGAFVTANEVTLLTVRLHLILEM
ncbi:carboxypeptidase regulatory-like domain-containing protein [Bacillus megaterium]|nr:carboxypeptidase regulatory-like domain-containing protein [Priestia megaterium]